MFHVYIPNSSPLLDENITRLTVLLTYTFPIVPLYFLDLPLAPGFGRALNFGFFFLLVPEPGKAIGMFSTFSISGSPSSCFEDSLS